MRGRWLVVIAVAFVGSFLPAVPAGAAPPTRPGPSWSVGQQFDQVMEHQTQGGATQEDSGLWVTNVMPGARGPDGERCVWDPDEWMHASRAGDRLRAGESISYRHCFVNDPDGQYLWLFASARLTGTLTIYDLAEPSRTWTFSGNNVCVYTELDLIFTGIGRAPFADPLPYDWYRIDNAGLDGIGRIYEAVWTFTATRNTSQDSARAQMDNFRNCPTLDQFTRDHLPAVWVDGLLVEDTGIDVRHYG